MKSDTHPTYHKNATVQCACGNTFAIGSTQEKIETEICSQCHPFYTGKGKLVDAAGRIEKFKARLEKQQKIQAKKITTKKPTKSGGANKKNKN